VTVFTIGHSNLALEAFLDLVCSHGIGLLVDVRSSPYCRYAVHFNRESLQAALGGPGIEYLYLGNVLGGRPAGDEFYDDDGYVLYDRLAASPAFEEGIDRLAFEAGQRRAAILCGEEDPTHCHRRLLIGRVLAERGVTVLHLRGDGGAQTEEELARAEEHARTGGQKTLFELEEPPGWKSTRSVSPGKAPPSSSVSCAEPESVD